MQAVGHFLDDQGRSVFRVYAPQHDALALQLANSTHPMQPAADGYWHLTLPRVAEGTRYQFIVEGRAYPDPASRWQPDGVHGASAVVSVPQVNRQGWSGIAIEDAIIYELHLGTFTPEGTLAAAQTRLPHLQALGITVIELMPLATFPGERNWGYDGTYLFALQPSYGNYADLVAFIEAAHGHGIAVILDVVYNHFGPEGNYAGCFAPYTKQADTPWGAAINFDGEHGAGIRDFYLANTRYWLEEIGFDGFRMDAVSLVFDTSPTSILREITNLARTIGEREQRQVLMIAEHLCNDVNVTAANGLAYHSQWNDDLNHALFAFLTGEQGRHYSSFGSFADIVHAMQNSFVLDGTREHKFYGRLFGTDGRQTHATEHVVHSQNHDQIGNRLHGDRLIATYGRDKALLACMAVMASPYVPMLFMGEEYGETAPFLFFEDFGDPALVQAVREGRQREFAHQGTAPREPHDRLSFEDSKLQWSLLDTEEGQTQLQFYRTLIELKRSGKLGPRDKQQVGIAGDPESLLIAVQTDESLTLMNFSAHTRQVPVSEEWGLILSSNQPGTGGLIPPFSAHIYLRIAD